jgi:XapX domain-containing protein
MGAKASSMKISMIVAEGSLEVKGILISFVVGLLVGIAYGLVQVKSPAPPIVALIGLLGMVLGEQSGVWLLAKKVHDASASSSRVLNEREEQQQRPNMESVVSAADQRNRQ